MKKKVIQIATVLLCVGIFLTVFLEVVHIDISDTEAVVQTVFQGAGFEKTEFACTGKELIQEGISGSGSSEEICEAGSLEGIRGEAETLIRTWWWLLLIPYGTALAIAVLGLIGKRWSYLVNAVLSLAGGAAAAVWYLWLIPSGVAAGIRAAAEPANVKWAERVLGLSLEEFVRSRLIQSTGMGILVLEALFLILLLTSVVLFFCTGASENHSEEVDFSAPAVLKCLFGDLEGAEIEFHNGQEIYIGRDAQRCNLVFSEAEISPLHCIVRYDLKKEIFQVIDLSEKGTFLNGRRRMKKNRQTNVKRGTSIQLGRKENTLFLR